MNCAKVSVSTRLDAFGLPVECAVRRGDITISIFSGSYRKKPGISLSGKMRPASRKAEMFFCVIKVSSSEYMKRS